MTTLSAPEWLIVSAGERIDGAAVLAAKGRRREAEAVLRGVLDDLPGHTGAIAVLGAIALAEGDAGAARRMLGAVLSAVPGHGEAAYNLAVAHRLSGDADAALAAAEHAAALTPDDVRAHLLLGGLLLERGALGPARAAAARALAQQPDNPDALVLAGAIALAGGGEDEALALVERATALAPDHAEAQLDLSELLARRGRRHAALAAAERAALAQPAHLDARTVLARRLAECGELDRAETAIKHVLAVTPEQIEPNVLWSRIALARGAVEKAVSSLAELVRRRGGDAAALAALAALLVAAGRREQALATLDVARAMPEVPAAATALRVAVLAGLGRFAEAWPASARPSDASFDAVVAQQAGDVAETLIALAAAERLAARRGRLVLYGASALSGLLPADGALRPEPGPPPAEPAAGLETTADPTAAGPVAATAPIAGLALAAAPAALGEGPYAVLPPRLDADRVAAWRAAFDGLPRPLIGLDWADGLSGPPFEALAEALDAVAGGTLVALASGERRRDLALRPGMLDGGRHLRCHADTAAAVSLLDAVVAPDGPVLALAGALGRPAVAVLPPGHGWAWSADADGRALWFPSVRVRIQPRPGVAAAAWRPPLADVAALLTPSTGGEG